MMKRQISLPLSPESDKDFIWMIRDKTSGFFSHGKMDPRFSIAGKVWDSHALLLTHLTMMNKYVEWQQQVRGPKANPHPYENCEVIKCKRTITVDVAIDYIGYGE